MGYYETHMDVLLKPTPFFTNTFKTLLADRVGESSFDFFLLFLLFSYVEHMVYLSEEQLMLETNKAYTHLCPSIICGWF